MANFKIPESPTFNYLDLNNLQGMDSWDTNPNIMRSSDMLNVVKKEGLHQVRHNVKQSYIVGEREELDNEDDIHFKIKYVGKIEEYDDSGNTVPYYIKISEYLGEYQQANDSRLCISVWPTPNVKNIKYDLSEEEGFALYKISHKFFTFTNYGESGNRQGLYEHIQFDGKERVFTPIGILSFKCSTEDVNGLLNGDPVVFKQLNFEVENVLDNPYVPTIIYGSTPSGLDYTRYEPINLLTNKRKAQFLSDGLATDYYLPEKHLSSANVNIKQLQADGTYIEVTSGFSVDRVNGIVSFESPPAKTPIEGKDNIIIMYTKAPPTTSDNQFNIECIAGDDLFETTINVDKYENSLDSTLLTLDLTITVRKGSKYSNEIISVPKAKITFNLGETTLSVIELTTAQINTLIANNSVIVTESIDIDKYLTTNTTNWNAKVNINYVEQKTTGTNTTAPGSVAANTTLGTQQKTCLGFSWIGLQYSGWAEGHVGTKTDGTDSYWTVYERVQLWVSRASYLQCGAGTLSGIIDGSRIQAGSTGNMYGSSTVYPSSPLTVSKKINYSATKTSVTLGAYLKFGTVVNLSGVNYTEMTAANTTMSLPKITLPKVTSTSETINTGRTSTGVNSYNETNTAQTNINYTNIVPGSARLGCYYGAKCVTVYGYESDRRVFVSDGTNKDTYSGVCMDGSSSIYYFPDDNYNVLGEDTEILGYAQKHGYLLTFKRGEDSVYVRYGTTQNNVTIFPSTVVTRNLQVLSRPIQLNDEILLVTRDGIKSISYISNEIRAELRSYFINNYFELSQDYNYDKMSWFRDDNLLHIFLDKYEFTCDLVTKSYVREGVGASGTNSATTLSFQYEWYVNEIDWLDNRKPPYVVTYQPKDFERQEEGIVYETQRAIGFSNDGVYEFFYNDFKVDSMMKLEDGEVKQYYKPIKAHYITPFLNMGAINVAKTIKYVYINTRSKNGDMFAVGYIDENGVTETMEKEYVTIEDYTTKLKNSLIPFPKLIQIKSKIRKFMNVKLYIQNRAELEDVDFIEDTEVANYGNMTFDRLLIQYQVAGKYRGE